MFAAIVIEAFISPFNVRYYHVYAVFLTIIVIGVVPVVFFVAFDFHSVQSPAGIIASLKGHTFMFLLFL